MSDEKKAIFKLKLYAETIGDLLHIHQKTKNSAPRKAVIVIDPKEHGPSFIIEENFTVDKDDPQALIRRIIITIHNEQWMAGTVSIMFYKDNNPAATLPSLIQRENLCLIEKGKLKFQLNNPANYTISQIKSPKATSGHHKYLVSQASDTERNLSLLSQFKSSSDDSSGLIIDASASRDSLLATTTPPNSTLNNSPTSAFTDSNHSSPAASPLLFTSTPDGDDEDPIMRLGQALGDLYDRNTFTKA